MLKEKSSKLIEIQNINIDAFKTRSSVVYMTLIFGDVNVSSKTESRNVAPF